jgi:hypothetical protein
MKQHLMGYMTPFTRSTASVVPSGKNAVGMKVTDQTIKQK